LRSFLQARDATNQSANPYKGFLTPLILLAMNTGLRRGELFQLRWQHINAALCLLTVAGETAKTGKTRHAPLNKEAMATLQAWRLQSPEESTYVFTDQQGQPLHQICHFWQVVQQEALIAPCRFHDLRHHFASKLVMAGVDLNTVRELLGHTSLRMTLRYAHLAPQHKAEAVAKLLD